MSEDWLEKSRLTRRLKTGYTRGFLPSCRLNSSWLIEPAKSSEAIARMHIARKSKPFPEVGPRYRAVCRLNGRPYRLQGTDVDGVAITQGGENIAKLLGLGRGKQRSKIELPTPPWAEQFPHSCRGYLESQGGESFWLCNRRSWYQKHYLADAQGRARMTWTISGGEFMLREGFEIDESPWLLAFGWYLRTIEAMED